MNYSRIMALGSLVLLLMVALSGCMDLAVENPNNPDRTSAITEPKDVESLIGGAYLTFWQATQLDDPAMTIQTMADVSTASWGNYGMQDMSSEPRMPFINATYYVYDALNRLPWQRLYRAISSVNDGLVAIKGGMKIMDGTKDNTRRAQAFAKFIQGISHAYAACFFDKALIIDENVDLTTYTVVWKTPAEVMAAALKMLDDAEALANQGAFADPLPSAWINGVGNLTNTEFVRVIRAYRARFRASAARTVAERQAADWTKIIADAQNGVNIAEWGPQGDGNFWWDALKWRGQSSTWYRGDYYTIAIADTAGGLTSWLNTPVSQRTFFVIKGPDRRITGSGAGTSSGTYFTYVTSSPFRDDRGTYHHSLYLNRRFVYHLNTSATGLMTTITLAEMDLLRAEGLWYQNKTANRQAVVDFINKTRVANGKMAPLTTAASDADIWKWLMYEKLIETMHTGSGTTWFDQRGWGRLVKGTALHFPVPARELEILGLPLYTQGGEGLPGGAPKSMKDLLVPVSSVQPH